jgi:hypothetical protein
MLLFSEPPEFGLYLQDEARSEKHEAGISKRKVFGLLFLLLAPCSLNLTCICRKAN